MDEKQEELHKAISNFDVESVEKLIKQGVNVNYTIPKSYFEDEYTTIEYEFHPFNALRLVIFRLADCNLTNEDMHSFLQITKLLLDAGADPSNVINYGYLDGYQPNNEEVNHSYFRQILDEIYFSHQKS